MSASATTRKMGKITNCPECGSANLVEDYDLGEIICHDCGLVLSEHSLNTGPEWRAFTKEEKDERGRVGLPTTFSIHDKGLSTVIDRVNRDASGRQLPLARRLEMLRLRKWQIRTRVHSSADRNLAQAMAAITAASLYAACRMSETPRTLKDVSAASRIRKKDVARCYRLLVRELDLRMPVVDPVKCISKIATKVEISMLTQHRAIRIINEAKKKGIVTGKDPMGLAAASLYVACVLERERKTQKEIAEVANVTEVTVRNRYKGLKEALNITFPVSYSIENDA